MASPPAGVVGQPHTPRVFISYKSNAEPDERLAMMLVDSLSRLQCAVFIDRQISPGEIWAQRIEREVRGCDWLLVVLSASSCHSEMVKDEIELARDQASRSGGTPRILPIRAAFRDQLPYPLGAYLNQIQHAFWDEGQDIGELVRVVSEAILGRADPPSLPPPSQTGVPSPRTQPPPFGQLRPPGGTTDLSDPCYVVRESERKALEVLAHGGQTIVIKGPRQTGKSSLLNRLGSSSLDSGGRLALIDLQLFDQAARENAEAFFGEFGRSIALNLDLSEPDAASISNPFHLTSFFERNVLNMEQTPFLLAIDEADLVFGASFQFDFFAMLRIWHNHRADPRRQRKAIWMRLNMALVTATEPYMFIDAPNQSPFNVGQVLRLEDFSAEQVSELNRLHAEPVRGDSLVRLGEILGGHPYLIRRALYEIAQAPGRITPESLLEMALADQGPFRDHLRHHWLNLERQPRLAESLREIARGRTCDDESVFYRLEGAGLVKRQEGRVVPRCLLYGEYFRTRLH
jgi:hypothetical protein